MISKDEVLKIARLARLELSDAEVEKMQKDLSSILDYFDILKNIDTLSVKSYNKSSLIINSNLREDNTIFEKSENNDKLIQSAPDKKDDYIKVKAIL